MVFDMAKACESAYYMYILHSIKSHSQYSYVAIEAEFQSVWPIKSLRIKSGWNILSQTNKEQVQTKKSVGKDFQNIDMTHRRSVYIQYLYI